MKNIYFGLYYWSEGKRTNYKQTENKHLR